jgi:phosphatidylinositol-3-phosphatase
MAKWFRLSVALLAALAVFATVAPTAGAARVPRLKHVWVFVLENHSYNEIIGNPQVPFLNRLARRHGLATSYYAVAHPSLPNYLAMISGSTHGCTSNGCNGNYRGKTLAGQFSRHGLQWRAYIEALPHAGYTGRDSGQYTRHHNPFVYFRSIVRKPRQRARIVPFTKFRRSLRHPPNLSYIVPTDAHNMHSGSEGVADGWVHTWVSRVMASRGFRHHGAIFITWDEASKGDSSGCCVEGVHGGHQPFIAIVHNGPARVRLAKRRSGYSLLRTIEAGFRFSYLGHARQVKPLAKFF